MSRRYENFLSKLLLGEVLADEVNDAIDEWHDTDAPGELHFYLGMTETEYEAFMHDGGALGIIAKARRLGRNFSDLLRTYAANDDEPVLLAARGLSHADRERLQEWLGSGGAERA